ncbi:hypothetical protein BBJ28_00015640 [Nothophytophthora sp. Chile5]|nr:hypothetical protein BBJ28_00015640 [Nothophytophthora sp. Chile5]
MNIGMHVIWILILGCREQVWACFTRESAAVRGVMRWAELFQRGRSAVPEGSWSAFNPKAKLRSVHPVEKLRVMKFPHLNLVQTRTHVSCSPLFLFSYCHDHVRINSVIVRLGTDATTGRLVSVSEHLFPREYDWAVWLVDNPSSANACCAPGGKIIVQTGILDLIDFAVKKGICHNRHDALAVVMAHEIGHALARHTAESMSMLPLLTLQVILGIESPLLKYIFQFGASLNVSFNLPFSRRQEAEADHIGIMLLASACYDPSEAPRLWKAFTAFYADPETEADALDLDFDWMSTHPSNRKRERALDGLVEAALDLQRRSSWCAFLQQKVLEFIGANTEAELLHHIRAAMAQAQAEEARATSQQPVTPTRRRNTVGTRHELESQEMYKVIQSERQEQQQEGAEVAAVPTTT